MVWSWKRGGSLPVDISSGLAITDGNLDVKQNISADDTIVGQTIVDLTPAYDNSQSQALNELLGIRKETKDGRLVIDHTSLPVFSQVTVQHLGEQKTGRSLGGMISIPTYSYIN